METHATTKKSLMGRLKNLVHKEKAEKIPVFKKTVVGPEVMGSPIAPEDAVKLAPPTQSPASNASVSETKSVPEEMGKIPELTDAEVAARIKEAMGGGAPAKAKDAEGHVHTAACKHSSKAKPVKSKKMRDLYPGYEGPKFTPKSPSPATLKQKLQKKARRLRRQTEK